MSKILTDENFMLVAMKHYDNQQLNTIEEFQQDINRVFCVQKIVEKYLSNKSKTINIRLVLNHCIILQNSFPGIVGDMFYLKFPDHYKSVVKPVLHSIGVLNDTDWNDIHDDDFIKEIIRIA